MSVHEDISDWADRLADGSLDEEERGALEAHAAECDECASALQGTSEPEVAEVVPEPGTYRSLLRGVATLFAVALLVTLGALFTATPAGAESDDEAVCVLPPRSSGPKDVSIEKSLDHKLISRGGGGAGGGSYGSRHGGKAVAVRTGGGATAVMDPREEAARSAQAERRLIFTADMKVEVDSFEEARTALTSAVATGRGYVASTSIVKGANGRVHARMQLRVPPAGFDALVAEIAGLGTLRSQTVATEDVTKAYYDFESRLKGKEAFAARLRKVLDEGAGTVKELMEVEVQIGNTLEAIDRIKGELRYYDQHITFSTVRLEIVEKDIAAPFEYVETLSARIGLVADDVDTVLASVQKAVAEAGGEAGAVQLSRATDGVSQSTLLVRVDADRFRSFRDVMRTLGHVTADTVDQAKRGVGGDGRGGPGAPVRKEEASVKISISTPKDQTTRRTSLSVQTDAVADAYASARRAAEDAGARILEGSLDGTSASRSARLKVELGIQGMDSLVAAWRKSGTVVADTTSHEISTSSAPVREQAHVTLTLSTPPPVIAEEQGVGRALRDTIGSSWSGLVWSVEKLFVGAALSVPWLLLAGFGWLLWRRFRRKPDPAPVPGAQ